MSKSIFKGKGSSFKDSWGSISATIIAIIALISGGYGAGNYLSNLSCEREKLLITEDYQNKIYEHRQSCNYSKIEELESKTNAIEISVEQLKTIQNEK